MSNCPRITTDGIRALSVGCKCLRTLILEYCQEVNDIALETIATHCEGLLRLNIRHCSVSDLMNVGVNRSFNCTALITR